MRTRVGSTIACPREVKSRIALIISVFRDISSEHMGRLSRHGLARRFPAHEVVIRVGEESGGLATATQLEIESSQTCCSFDLL
jgi:hypothetical protein